LPSGETAAGASEDEAAVETAPEEQAEPAQEPVREDDDQANALAETHVEDADAKPTKED
jgi:hypothetical protein